MECIYIDESGSIDNSQDKDFIITLVHPTTQPRKISNNLKRFVANNHDELKRSETEIIKKMGRRPQMFVNNKFVELKGAMLTPEMKIRFIDYFIGKKNFELIFIHIINKNLPDAFCNNVSGTFNRALKRCIEQLINDDKLNTSNGFHLMLDERNEKKKAQSFLEIYLNTEIGLDHNCSFNVSYWDSKDNKIIQMADVFSNIYYTSAYNRQINKKIQDLKNAGIITRIFDI